MARNPAFKDHLLEPSRRYDCFFLLNPLGCSLLKGKDSICLTMKPSRTLQGPPKYKGPIVSPPLFVCRKAVVSQAAAESQKSRLKLLMIRTTESQNL